jgi:thioredoxin 1
MSQIHEATEANFETDVIGSEQPVLVDFTATWLFKVDVDKAPSVAAKFGVMSVPTLILFQGGAIKDQVVGVLSKRALSDRVDKAL